MSTGFPDALKLRRFYRLVAIGCAFFILSTFIAMLAYTGGTYENHSSPGYSFTHNFFSDLGRVTALSGRTNWVSAVLFFLALSFAGSCLVFFFIFFPRFFNHKLVQRLFCLAGSAFGVLAGICFVGVAFTPADIALSAHGQFVIWAFRLFPLAVLFYIPAMFIDRYYPRVYAWVFAIFCLMLVGYLVLITNGPSFTSPQGIVIQAVGQKVIVYASILSIGIESLGANRYLQKLSA